MIKVAGGAGFRDQDQRAIGIGGPNRPHVLALEDGQDLHDAGAEAGLMERRLDAQRAWALLLTLPAPKRKALVLRLEFGHSYEEIAQILACPIGTVRSRIHSGLEELRAAMGETVGGNP